MDMLFEKLSKIHTKAFDHFEYQTDEEHYGEEEKWVMPDVDWQGITKFVGDCEDFALACRKLCRAAGVESRLVICTVGGEGHCVLEADGWILDNRFENVFSRDYLEKNEGYVWICISGVNPGDEWTEITG